MPELGRVLLGCVGVFFGGAFLMSLVDDFFDRRKR